MANRIISNILGMFVRRNFAGIEFVNIPSGRFNMGSHLDSDEKPIRIINISSFFMAKKEVTFAQWKDVYSWAIDNGYEFHNKVDAMSGAFNADINCPMVNINWYDCIKWCNAASELQGRIPCYYLDNDHREVFRKGQEQHVTCEGAHDIRVNWVKWDANGYRLPTEAEWEYACRGGTTTDFYWGNFPVSEFSDEYFDDLSDEEEFNSNDISLIDWIKITAEYAWDAYNSNGQSHPVGLKLPNTWGLYDMSGNVSEWCWDWYNSVQYKDVVDYNPKGPDYSSQMTRIIRGGSFLSNVSEKDEFFPLDYSMDNELRSANREYSSPRKPEQHIGFRLATGL